MALKSNQFVGNVFNFLIPDDAQDQFVGNVSNFLIPDGAQEQSVSWNVSNFLIQVGAQEQSVGLKRFQDETYLIFYIDGP